MPERRDAEEAALQIGDRVRTRTGGVGVIFAIFETPWDTLRKGADNTRTVAEVEGDGWYEHVFLEHLERA